LDRVCNKFNCSALTLAAVLGKLELFEYLIQKKKVVLWKYGKVQAVGYPMDEIDTIKQSEYSTKVSAVEMIMSNQPIAGHLIDCTPIMQSLQAKWAKFTRWFFFLFFFGYFLFFFFFFPFFLLFFLFFFSLICEF
jgi:hypothetical protein